MNKHGFTLLREEHLKEVGGTVRLWIHDATGAELLSVLNEDENKSFGVSFRTPPKDSSGVAHILEHSVLCGSKKYPVKEPFVELLKSSLQTFLNALTFPDKTCYPVASTNLRDFYNLVDVYIDAVFHPRIDEDVLRQEGWHIDVDEKGRWSYKGVVYNEMKGVYSSPDSVLMEESQHAVFPDTLYSLDSGGNPPDVLNLTYEAFRAFHAAYYHPSNARFFFWGDDEEDARLARLEEALAGYTRRETDSSVPLQIPHGEERKLEIPYAATEDSAAEGEEAGRQAHVTVNWLLCESADVREMLTLEMLDHILAGLPGSPLRKALMESGLGDDIAGAGLETDLRQAYYSIGLRSIRPEDGDEVEKLILDTLAGLVEEGIPARAVEAAVNSVEFDLRENNTGRFPRGLASMFRSLSTWLYGGDPFAPLAWQKPLEDIKKRLASGEKIFENAIRGWLLDNRHRAQVLLLPDSGLAARRQEEEEQRLEKARSAMSEAEKLATAEISARLHEAQARPDSPEALATIPTLEPADLPRLNRRLPCTERPGTVDVLLHELDTTGILYARLLLPLDAVPVDLLPLLPLYARALTEAGTKRHDYVELGLELAARTGGLDAFPSFHTRISDASALPYLEIAGKATTDKIRHLADLMREILLDADLDHAERFTQMVMEERARLEQSLIPSGHSLVGTRLGGALSAAGAYAELCGGTSYLEYIRALSARVRNDWPSLLEDLRRLHSLVAALPETPTERAATLSLTADAATLEAALPLFRDTALALPRRTDSSASVPGLVQPGAEGLIVPAQVNYVGLGGNLRDTGYAFHGSALVVLPHLLMCYLWDRVRVPGGAYAAFVSHNRATGSLVFLSYRDPNVERTLDIYRGAADYLGNLRLSESDVARAVVGAIGDMDAYMLPGAKGATAMWRALCGDTDELRDRIREEALSTTLKDFHDFAPWLAKTLKASVPCALGGSEVENVARANGWATKKLL